jgi:hypothetical protein
MGLPILVFKKTYIKVDFSTSENKDSNFIALRQKYEIFYRHHHI